MFEQPLGHDTGKGLNEFIILRDVILTPNEFDDLRQKASKYETVTINYQGKGKIRGIVMSISQYHKEENFVIVDEIKLQKIRDKEDCESCSNQSLQFCMVYDKKGNGLNIPLKNIIKPCNHYNKAFDLTFEQTSKVKEKCENNDARKSLEEIVNDVKYRFKEQSKQLEEQYQEILNGMKASNFKLISKEDLVKEISEMCGLPENELREFSLHFLINYKNSLINQKEFLEKESLKLKEKEENKEMEKETDEYKYGVAVLEYQKEESTKEKIERLEKSIQEVKDKRKKILENLIEKINDKILKAFNSGTYLTLTEFDEFLKKKKILNKKEFKIFRMIEFYLKEKTIEFDFEAKSYAYKKELWDLLVRFINIIVRYQNEFLEIKEKKELCRLTKCLDEMDGSNPCKYTCEKCGKVNAIDANFCSECGGKL